MDFQSPQWLVYIFPVTNLLACQRALLHTLSCNLLYNSKDLWECCVEFWLQLVQEDLNCKQPETWHGGVFC